MVVIFGTQQTSIVHLSCVRCVINRLLRFLGCILKIVQIIYRIPNGEHRTANSPRKSIYIVLNVCKKLLLFINGKWFYFHRKPFFHIVQLQHRFRSSAMCECFRSNVDLYFICQSHKWNRSMISLPIRKRWGSRQSNKNNSKRHQLMEHHDVRYENSSQNK